MSNILFCLGYFGASKGHSKIYLLVGKSNCDHRLEKYSYINTNIRTCLILCSVLAILPYPKFIRLAASVYTSPKLTQRPLCNISLKTSPRHWREKERKKKISFTTFTQDLRRYWWAAFLIQVQGHSFDLCFVLEAFHPLSLWAVLSFRLRVLSYFYFLIFYILCFF